MTYSEMVSEVVQENQKLRWENAILKNQMDDTNAEKERADKAESLVRELVGVIDELRRQINECGLDGEMWDVYQKAKEVLGDGNNQRQGG